MIETILIIAIPILAVILMIILMIRSVPFEPLDNYCDTEDGYEPIPDLKQLYGWFHPEFAETYGSSVYSMRDGRKIKITHVSCNPEEFKNRLVGNMVYYGPVKKFIKGCPGHRIEEENIDIIDIALLYLVVADFFTPYDEFANTSFDIIEPPEYQDELQSQETETIEDTVVEEPEPIDEETIVDRVVETPTESYSNDSYDSNDDNSSDDSCGSDD